MYDGIIITLHVYFQLHRMNYNHNRANVRDVIILVTTRSLRDSPSWDSDVTKANNEFQMFSQMGAQVVTLALGRGRLRIRSQIKQMTTVYDPVVLSSFSKLIRSDIKVQKVMEAVCPDVEREFIYCYSRYKENLLERTACSKNRKKWPPKRVDH